MKSESARSARVVVSQLLESAFLFRRNPTRLSVRVTIGTSNSKNRKVWSI